MPKAHTAAPFPCGQSVATKELRMLRHNYKVAYTAYLSCVQMVSDASQTGARLPEEELEKEDKAFDELAYARQALLDAISGKGQVSK
jgi:hypothetical protein